MKKVFLFLALAVITAWATPNLISYQGKLDKDGEPFSGEVSMTFSLYESENAGTTFWNETQTVTVVSGIFNVLLGSVEELPALPLDECWLEVAIDGDALPRQQITSVPYAEVAQQVCANYQAAEDTVLEYICSTEGVLLAGYSVLSREGLYGGLSLYIDDTRLTVPTSSGSGNTSSCACGAMPVQAGSHKIRIVGPLYEIASVRLWAMFMR